MKVIEAGQLEFLRDDPDGAVDGVLIVGRPDEVRDMVAIFGLYRDFDTKKVALERDEI